jgi:hypothetical protein
VSNLWSYNLLLAEPEQPTLELLDSIFQIVRANGYSAKNPVSGFFAGMQFGGLREFAFDTQDKAATFLSRKGGNLQLWKGNVDIGLNVEVRHLKQAQGENARNSLSTAMLESLSIVVDNTFFRYGDNGAASMEAALDMQMMFLDLCGLLQVPYGYSADEDILEVFLGKLPMVSDLINYGTPRFLFWLQYFSTSCLGTDLLQDLSTLGATPIEVDKGVLVKFFDYPWEVDVSKLTDLNRRWQLRRTTS